MMDVVGVVGRVLLEQFAQPMELHVSVFLIVKHWGITVEMMDVVVVVGRVKKAVNVLMEFVDVNLSVMKIRAGMMDVVVVVSVMMDMCAMKIVFVFVIRVSR
jgi:hypothetical protein